MLQVAPVPDVIDVSRLGFRKDGTSIYRPPGEERFVSQGAPRPRAVPGRRGHDAGPAAGHAGSGQTPRWTGTDLDYSQRAGLRGPADLRAAHQLPRRPGRDRQDPRRGGVRAGLGAEVAGGRVIGLTASTNAARVMADEARQAGAPMETFNIAKFLGKIKDSDETRGHVPVYPGDVLVIDEASQVSTDDMLRIVQVARRCGAMVIEAGDTEQLGAVDAGGMFRLIAARHGSWRLAEVRRFRNAWEREASLKLRDGDIAALAEYAARGRIYHGPQDRVYDDAVTLWMTDHHAGRETLLLAASNEEAARLSRLARERLIERRQVADRTDIVLADGNPASTGDLVRARLNTRIEADGQTLANRDTIRIDGWQDSGLGRLAVVSRQDRAGPVVPAVLRPGRLPGVVGRTGLRGQRPRRAGPHDRHRAPGGQRGNHPRPAVHREHPGPGEEHHSRGDRRAGSGAADPRGARGVRRRGHPEGSRAAPGRGHGGRQRGVLPDAGPAERPADGPVGSRARAGHAARGPRGDRPGGDAGRAGLRHPHRPPPGALRGVLAAGRGAEDR